MKKRMVAFSLALSCISTLVLGNVTAVSALAADDSEFLLPINFSEHGLGCNVEDVDYDSIYNEFFDLPLDEIEFQLDVSRSKANTNKIVVSFSNDQLRKLIAELESQKEEIGNDADLFRIAFFDLFLEKLHLTGIYDTVDPEYINADLPSAWWNPMNPFVVEECDNSSQAYITLLYPESEEAYTFENGDERVSVDRYEATQRSLYVINTYGDKEYFSTAYEELSSFNAKPIASDEELCRWAEKDYMDKTGRGVSSSVEEKTDGKLTIALTDKSGETVDTYIIDVASGIGTNSSDAEVNLPQTGNNSMRNILIAVAALMLTAIGTKAVYSSGILRRKEDEK